MTRPRPIDRKEEPMAQPVNDGGQLEPTVAEPQVGKHRAAKRRIGKHRAAEPRVEEPRTGKASA